MRFDGEIGMFFEFESNIEEDSEFLRLEEDISQTVYAIRFEHLIGVERGLESIYLDVRKRILNF